MDSYNIDGYGDNNENGDGDRTRDFFSQPNPFSHAGGYKNFNDTAHPFPGSSNVNAPRAGMAALDLNSHGQEWPRMAGYEGLLRSSPQGGGTDDSMGPPPVHVRSGSRIHGLRAAHIGGGGGAMAARTVSSSSGGGRGPHVPPVTADVRFTFVLAGWPSSVHGMRVFTDAMTKYNHVFPHPPTGKHLPMQHLQVLV